MNRKQHIQIGAILIFIKENLSGFLLLIMLYSLPLLAREVTLPMMQKVIQNFSREEMGGRNILSLEEIKDNEVIGYLGRFEGGGYAIFTNNTDLYPVLSFSTTGQFKTENEDIPWQFVQRTLKGWGEIPNQGPSSIQNNRGKWNAYLSELPQKSEHVDSLVWGPLLKTQWGQTAPFNKYCPLIEENGVTRAPAGCGAVALGQIMYYLKHIDNLTLCQYDEYTFKNRVNDCAIPANSETLNFPNFEALNQMLSHIQFDNSDEEAAILVFSVGVLLKSIYKETGTSSEFFNYRMNRVGLDYVDNGLKFSKDHMIRNIKEKQPVLAELSKGKILRERHAVVIDGYRSKDDFFHVNFGWSGSSNDWWHASSINEYTISSVYYDLAPLDSILPNKATIISPANGEIVEYDGKSGNYLLRASDVFDKIGIYTTESRFYVGTSPDSLSITFGSKLDWHREGEREMDLSEYEPGTYYWKVVKRGGVGYSESEMDSFTIDKSLIVTIPDPNFLKALCDKGVDANGDGLINYAEAETTYALDIHDYQISDLTGIEFFKNLTSLLCSNNKLSSLNLSKNSRLHALDCSQNALKQLDVSDFNGLRLLQCAQNKLQRLDVSKNPLLSTLNCDDNQLTDLNLSQNTKLMILSCGGNLLNKLNVSLIPNLYDLRMSDMPSLQELIIHAVPFDYLSYNLHGGIDGSIYYYFSNLDTTGSPNVILIDGSPPKILNSEDLGDHKIAVKCSEAATMYLVPAGTKDTSLIRKISMASSNIHLGEHTGVISLPKTKEGEYWLYARDEAGNLSDYYSLWHGAVNIPDQNFLACLGSIDENNDGQISMQEAYAVKELYLYCDINNLTGISAFKYLERLYVRYDIKDMQLLDFSNNIHLKEISCSGDRLIDINLSKNTELQTLYLGGSSLSALDLSQNQQLRELILENMTNLNGVCVWTEPFPTSEIDTSFINSPNIQFTTACAPTKIGYDENVVVENKISMYPNPVQNNLTISTIQPAWYSIKIVSLKGQELLSTTMSGNIKEIDLSNLQAGLYLITLQSHAAKTTQKLIKL